MNPLPYGVVFHGVVAVIIILVVIAIVILGVVSLLRLTGRGAKKVVDSATHHDDRSRS